MTDDLADGPEANRPLVRWWIAFWSAHPKRTKADHLECERQYRALLDWLILKEEYAARRRKED